MSALKKVSVTIHKGTIFVSTDLDGTSDPYVKIYTEKDEKAAIYKTAVQSSTLEPVWEETVILNLAPESTYLRFVVRDKDPVGFDHVGEGILHLTTTTYEAAQKAGIALIGANPETDDLIFIPVAKTKVAIMNEDKKWAELIVSVAGLFGSD